MTVEQVADIIALRKCSDYKHKCAFCKEIEGILDVTTTTVDANGCDFALKIYCEEDCKHRDESGNSRDFPCGLKTIDNGGGYFIISCPNFRRMNDSSIYQMYIRSKRWKETARQRMILDGFKCQMCGTGKNLVVHHITYERLVDEDMDDLVTVCKSCHQKIHSEDLKGKDNAKS